MARTLKRLAVVVLVVSMLLHARLAETQYATYPPKNAADPFLCGAARKGAIYYNTTTNKLRHCPGGIGWLDVGSGAGSELDAVVEKSIALTAVQPNPAPATTTAAWVTATSIIVCEVKGTTADGLTPEAINAAKLGITTENYVVGASFDIRVENFYGLEGTIRVQCIGR